MFYLENESFQLAVVSFLLRNVPEFSDSTIPNRVAWNPSMIYVSPHMHSCRMVRIGVRPAEARWGD